jgi:general stress protein 26
MGDINREDAIRRIDELIRDVPVAMLTTTSARGWLRSRPMVAQRLPFDGSLWFLTSGTAAKASEVRNRHRVNVSYSSPERDRYVSISGIAEVVVDRQRAAALWNASYEPWLPQGLDDPDLVLIRVNAEEAEYWDASAKKMVIVSELLQPRPVFRDVEPAVGR